MQVFKIGRTEQASKIKNKWWQMTGDSADSGCWDITSFYWLTNNMLNRMEIPCLLKYWSFLQVDLSGRDRLHIQPSPMCRHFKSCILWWILNSKFQSVVGWKNGCNAFGITLAEKGKCFFYVERVTVHCIKINDHSCFYNLWPNSKTKLILKHLWEKGALRRGPYAACVLSI